mmetsp:Transcript_8416/g.19661  ORF Transcript_8416/g.19661 Transcript_8416/m.19661 type:complete len:253 (-) Transcript_8416:4-762(-)
MPPHAMMPSLFSMRFSITRILSLILAPPTMARRGRSTFSGSMIWEKASSSLSTRRPETQGILPLQPTSEECARWAVPKASDTNTSPFLARDSRNLVTSSSVALNGLPSSSTPLPSSSTWKRTFSRTMMDPSAGLAQAASTSAPTQSERKVTGLPMSSPSLSAMGLRENFGLARPSGRPRWDMRITALAPLSRASLIVGMAPLILWLLVMLPCLSWGTLKSTRMSTLLPLTSTSLMDFLLNMVLGSAIVTCGG